MGLCLYLMSVAPKIGSGFGVFFFRSNLCITLSFFISSFLLYVNHFEFLFLLRSLLFKSLKSAPADALKLLLQFLTPFHFLLLGMHRLFYYLASALFWHLFLLIPGLVPAINQVGDGRENERDSQQRPTQPALYAHNLSLTRST